MMDLGLTGKTALVMAGTRGLGFGCAAALAAEGARVVINGRDPERGLAAAARLGPAALFVAADIRLPAERARLFEAARSHLGTIAILVTNADGPPGGTFLSKTAGDWQAAFELVLLSALDLVRRCLPEMMENGFGRIVNISSTSAKEASPGYPLATGLKPGLVGALGALAREVAASGVTINSLLPGSFDTDRIRRAAAQMPGATGLPPEETLRLYAAGKPMKRTGTIEEFGALCAFLCSRQAAYITGQGIVIDGGQVTSLL